MMIIRYASFVTAAATVGSGFLHATLLCLQFMLWGPLYAAPALPPVYAVRSPLCSACFASSLCCEVPFMQRLLCLLSMLWGPLYAAPALPPVYAVKSPSCSACFASCLCCEVPFMQRLLCLQSMLWGPLYATPALPPVYAVRSPLCSACFASCLCCEVAATLFDSVIVETQSLTLLARMFLVWFLFCSHQHQ